MQTETLKLIETLIGFDTVSRNSNLELIAFIENYLNTLGIKSERVISDDGNKANLFASIGPQVEGGVILSGHTDVVPVDGQPWDTDPFTLTHKDDKFYGRGTADMKSFIAIALAKVPAMLKANLKRPIHLAFSYDEEVGCQGAPRMIKRMLDTLPKPAAAIIGEPTMMQPIVAHKGLALLDTKITGHEAHSSQVHRGVSAVMTAAKLIQKLQTMMDDNAAHADQKSTLEPPFTTLHVGMVNGGTAANIIARECAFSWDVRTHPGDLLPDYLEPFKDYCQQELQKMHAIAPETTIETEVIANAPPLTDDEGKAQQLAAKLSGIDELGVAPFGTEAGQFQREGISAVVCGPGSIDVAHQPNEYIEMAQISAGEAFIDGLIAESSK